jgi:phosphatidylserine decarboxylase
MYIHKEGRSYVLIATLIWAAIGFLLSRINMPQWLFIGINVVIFPVWFWVLWFFRIPNRQLVIDDNLIIAPADGKVVVIEETEETEYFKDRRLQVSIFMSPLNVHVNRNPISGTVKYAKYHAGKFLVAWHPKSSTENERTTVVFSNPKIEILARQIAGAVARRIVLYMKGGEQVKQCDEFGFIKFGSRVDLFLPLGTKVDVKIDQKVQGGQTIIARIP